MAAQNFTDRPCYAALHHRFGQAAGSARFLAIGTRPAASDRSKVAGSPDCSIGSICRTAYRPDPRRPRPTTHHTRRRTWRRANPEYRSMPCRTCSKQRYAPSRAAAKPQPPGNGRLRRAAPKCWRVADHTSRQSCLLDLETCGVAVSASRIVQRSRTYLGIDLAGG